MEELTQEDDDGYLHPLYKEYLRVTHEDLYFYEKVYGKPERLVERNLNLLSQADDPQGSYRKKVKGFHIAFNIREPKKDENELSKYQYKPVKNAKNLTAEQIKQKVAAAKYKRIEEKKQQEIEEKLKHEKDR